LEVSYTELTLHYSIIFLVQEGPYFFPTSDSPEDSKASYIIMDYLLLGLSALGPTVHFSR